MDGEQEQQQQVPAAEQEAQQPEGDSPSPTADQQPDNSSPEQQQMPAQDQEGEVDQMQEQQPEMQQQPGELAEHQEEDDEQDQQEEMQQMQPGDMEDMNQQHMMQPGDMEGMDQQEQFMHQQMLNQEQQDQMSPEQQEQMHYAMQQQYDQMQQQQQDGMQQDPNMMAQMHMQMQQEGMDQQQYYEQGIPIQQQQDGHYQYAMPDDQQIGDEGQDYGQDQQEQEYMQTPEEKMRQIMHEIESLVQGTDFPWSDPEFPASAESLYLNSVQPPDWASTNVEWKRPHEIYTGEGEPMMMKDGFSPGDVKQGELGDCWLLGAFLTLATNPDLLSNLIYHNGMEFGYCVFRFFKNGCWQFVVVDTMIPYSPSTKEPLYARCVDPQEFWVPLIEKAYAKLHGCYEILNGGKMGEGMVDLSGGVSEKFNLTAPETKELLDNGVFWKEMKKNLKNGYLVGCAKSQKAEDGKQEEGTGPNGITFNHAYGLLRMEDVTITEQLQLLYIRNPWGPGPGEWNGRFCDEDEAWDDQPKLRERLGYQFKNDGNWWMDYKQWKENYNKVYVCKIFPSTWAQFSIAGHWQGITHGGPYPALADRDEENKDSKVHLDTNDKWFNNPQYRLSVTKKTQVIISLMQEDFALSKKPYIPVNFLVVRVKSKRDRLWEVDRDDIEHEAAKGLQRFKQREITSTLWLSPTHNNKPCHYIIVPNIESESVKTSDERPFFLRVFASDPIDLVELPATIEQSFTSKWDTKMTAGGKRTLDNGRENQFWCRNPQYFLNITKPSHLKIILRKKKGRRVAGNPIGLTVTKANPPTTPPSAEIIGKGKDRGKVTLPSSLSRSYGQTLRQTIKKEKGGDNVPEFEPPRLTTLERKLQILPNEWYQETTYKSDDVASMYAFYQPTQGPFIVVPSMSQESTPADFTLTIYSSQQVEVQQLVDSRNVVLSSTWEKRSGGGCHLYDKEYESKTDSCTWMQNPKFLLTLETQSARGVKITLSRPEKAWKKQIGMALVGSMIGFYVYPADIQPTKDNVINKDTLKFVPWCLYAEEFELDGRPSGYIIMPTTYEPGKIGPFNISVSTDVDFTLTSFEQ